MVIALAVAVGWWTTLDQVLTDGWIAGGGTGRLVLLSVAGTVGAVGWALSARRVPSAWIAGCLLLAAVAPVGFAWPISLVLLAFCGLEMSLVFRGAATLRRGERPA